MPPTPKPKPSPTPRNSSVVAEAQRQHRAEVSAQRAQRPAIPERQRPAEPSRPAPERAPKPKLEGSAYGVPTTVDIAKRVGQGAARARVPTGNRQYQGVILAEFLVAALIVALAPLARGKAAQDQTTGPSPYGVDDVKQLAGIGAVYFVLALLSSGKWGRYSAWFGGLVLVAIGLAQTTSGGLPAIFGIFQPSSKSAGSSDAPGQLVQLGPGTLPEPLGPVETPITFTSPGVVVSDQGNVQVNP